MLTPKEIGQFYRDLESEGVPTEDRLVLTCQHMNNVARVAIAEAISDRVLAIIESLDTPQARQS